MNKITRGLLALLASAALSPAAVITANPGSAPGTAGYAFHLTLDPSDNDTSSFAGTVGSWSWEDASLGLGNGIGWRHQSQWIAITLSGPSSLEVSMRRNDLVADDKLFPSFSIYRNHTNITSSHFYENNQTLSWDSNLSFVGLVGNSTLGEVSDTFELPAGNYTLVLGGNATSEAVPVNVNYLTDLAVSPSTIPEPSSIALSLLAGFGLLARRKR